MPIPNFANDLRALSPSRARRLATVALSSAALLAALDVSASEDLARAKGCLACHAVQTKVVGPAYKDVAARYAGQADAEEKLAQKVVKGSQGAWGFVPMPPNANVSAEEARTLVKWILANP
jgi:cytochrome c